MCVLHTPCNYCYQGRCVSCYWIAISIGKVLLPSSFGGAYLLGGDSPDVRARLPHFAPAELCAKHSSLHIERDFGVTIVKYVYTYAHIYI